MYEYNCKILRVVDGDTVDVDIDLGFGMWQHKERIRIYGLDTPNNASKIGYQQVASKNLLLKKISQASTEEYWASLEYSISKKIEKCF